MDKFREKSKKIILGTIRIFLKNWGPFYSCVYWTLLSCKNEKKVKSQSCQSNVTVGWMDGQANGWTDGQSGEKISRSELIGPSSWVRSLKAIEFD